MSDRVRYLSLMYCGSSRCKLRNVGDALSDWALCRGVRDLTVQKGRAMGLGDWGWGSDAEMVEPLVHLTTL